MEAIAAAVAAGTPVARLMQILRTGFSGAPAGWQVWSNLALGIACFLAAWAGFARFADRALDAAPARGRISGIRFRRPPRPWKNALAWKDFHFLGGGKPGFVLRVLVYGGAAAWMVAGTIGADGNSAVVVGSISSSLISFAFLLELAVVASRIFRSELRDQTWPDLVLLPLTVRQVAWRKLSGLLLALVPAGVAAILASGLTVLTAGRISGVAWSGGFSPAVILASALSSGITALFIAHLVAFLSLLMKRGALALGFVIAYAVSTAIQIFAMTLIFAGAGFGSASASALATRMMIGPLVTSAIHLVAVFFLHRAILLRLEALAAEG